MKKKLALFSALLVLLFAVGFMLPILNAQTLPLPLEGEATLEHPDGPSVPFSPEEDKKAHGFTGNA